MIIVGSNHSSSVQIILFLRIKRVRIFTLFRRFSFWAILYTFLQIVLGNFHFRNDTLQTHQLIGHSTTEPSWSYKISTQISLDLYIKPLNLALSFSFSVIIIYLFLQVFFNQNIVFWRILNYLLSGFGIFGTIRVNVKSKISWISNGLCTQKVCKETIIIFRDILLLNLHIGAFCKNYNLIFAK